MPIFRRWRGDAVRRELFQTILAQSVADLLAVHLDEAPVDGFQMVDAAQEGRFSRAGRAEDHDDLARHDIEIDALQHFQLVEGLMDVACPNERLRGLRRRSMALPPAQ